ncbi:hypothetical protein CPB84DRAFT_1803605 [Gymnopilus junonius]|uniref:Uncharacterized protein n=1 Tax=Gymnopilus junonius TaxID=109634 RepID=A0A9P5TFI9_GYMJU|nr:hypothetical protein CPB84DRAFT_1803605 [Gymnopilus junonius]
MSPEKAKGRGASTKYVRGGLADYASLYFDRSLTAYALWKKDIKRNPSAFRPEFNLSVVKILHLPPPSRAHSKLSASMNTSSPGIALCRIQSQTSSSLKSDHLYRAVFLFLNVVDSSDPMSPALFVEGKTILVFKPWHEVSFCPENADGEVLEGNTISRLPASLPLSEHYSTPDPLDAPVSDIGLFITRFYIKS